MPSRVSDVATTCAVELIVPVVVFTVPVVEVLLRDSFNSDTRFEPPEAVEIKVFPSPVIVTTPAEFMLPLSP